MNSLFQATVWTACGARCALEQYKLSFQEAIQEAGRQADHTRNPQAYLEQLIRDTLFPMQDRSEQTRKIAWLGELP